MIKSSPDRIVVLHKIGDLGQKWLPGSIPGPGVLGIIVHLYDKFQAGTKHHFPSHKYKTT